MNQFITDFEIALIENVRKVRSKDECPELVKEYVDILNAVAGGNYELVLTDSVTRQILKIELPEDGSSSSVAISQQLEENVRQFLSCESEEEKSIRQLIVLTVAVSCLQLFVQNNWVGPLVNLDPVSVLCSNSSASQQSYLMDFASNYLSIDGEQIYQLSKGPMLLAVARVILSECSHYLNVCKTSSLWLMRCLQTQQALLEERSPALKSAVLTIITNMNECELFGVSHSLAMQFHLEAGHLLYFYYEDVKARGHFQQAETISGLTVQLTGVLGKRTKYQSKDVSQLVLQVERTTGQSEPEEESKVGTLPKNVAFEDDALLESIQLKEPGSVTVAPMTALDQAMVLGLCHHHRKTHEGQGKIVQEESLAFINCVLSQPRDWCVRTKALLMRAKWETETSRQAMRTLSQLEELVAQFGRTDVPGFERLPFVYSASLAPKWITERSLADLLMESNAFASALEIYVRLQMWEDVIKCNVILGHRNEAEKIIRDQIAIKETSTLWCYLGDVTSNPDDYLRAWDLSNGRSARAQRSLAYLYVRNRELEKSLPYFEKSLEINSLQIGVWFTYGCTCLSCGLFDKAAKAFRRCVNLNNDNFEAWNNLATAYIRANDKRRAFLTLQEAIRCDYENWRMWENYLLVSIDIGEFDEVIQSYNRLIEIQQESTDGRRTQQHKGTLINIQQKCVDVQVLTILVRAVKDNITDASGQPSSRLRSKVLHLLKKITSMIVQEPNVWHLYAQLTVAGTTEEISQDDVQNALKHYLSAYRFYTMDSKWDSDFTKCKAICEQFAKLTEEYDETLERLNDNVQRGQKATSARFMINSLTKRIQDTYLDPVTNDLPKELAEPIQSLEKSVQKFLAMAKST